MKGIWVPLVCIPMLVNGCSSDDEATGPANAGTGAGGTGASDGASGAGAKGGAGGSGAVGGNGGTGAGATGGKGGTGAGGAGGTGAGGSAGGTGGTGGGGVVSFIDTYNGIHAFLTFDYKVTDVATAATHGDYVWGAEQSHIAGYRASSNPKIVLSR